MPAKRHKPYPTFPLTPHGNRWVKKIRGKVHTIAGDVDHAEALRIWHQKAPALLAGKPERSTFEVEHFGVRDLCNKWLAVKLADAEAGVIRKSYYTTCRRAVVNFAAAVGPDTAIGNLTPDDFTVWATAVRAKDGVAQARKFARLVTAMLNHADEEDWIDRPIKVGKRFKGFARAKSEKTRRTLPTPDQVKKIVKAIADRAAKMARTKERDPDPANQLNAQVLLALNGGYGAADLAGLPREVIDLDAAVIDYRRQKTRIERIVPLWPETVAALRTVLANRKGDPLVFRTREGNPVSREAMKTDDAGKVTVTSIDNVNQEYSKVLRKLGLKRSGEGFYTLKYVHRTHTDEIGDQHAAYKLLGHALPGSADPYVTVTVERLRKLTDELRHRLIFQSSSGSKKNAASALGSAASVRAVRASRSSNGARGKTSRAALL